MYPFIGDGSLSAKLLDPGRDDYYGHAGAWTDSQDSPWLVRLDGRFPSISQSLQQAGLTSSFTKYLVYYDGPSEEDNVCGQGGSANPASGQGLAVV